MVWVGGEKGKIVYFIGWNNGDQKKRVRGLIPGPNPAGARYNKYTTKK